ncbi:MAG TPA: homocysteine S-methyltransferase family protein [Terriglobia bacterium]|nr:homocysteine S-methyltransferase family protein [Terriglobia bacterium]
MGTRLYAKGIAPGACLEELNLSRPELVREVHAEYRAAGAEILKSNTFGANPVRLARHQRESQCRELNIAGVRLARAEAGSDGVVAGSVGPLGGTFPEGSAKAFALQISALAEGGADCILLETFRDLYELSEAVHAAHEVAALPVIAQVSPDKHGELNGGLRPEEYVAGLSLWGVDAIGCNCGAGLEGVLETIRRMSALTDKPLAAQPSAGLPFSRRGVWIYPDPPEELARAATRFLRLGARLIGGCCGTTPAHILAMRQALEESRTRPLPPATEQSISARRRWTPRRLDG